MLLRLLQMLAMRRKRRGAGGGGIWTAVGLAAFLLRHLQQRSGRDEVALREEIRPGESLVISHTTRPHR